MRRGTIIGVAVGLGLTFAVWQGVRNASDASADSEPGETTGATERTPAWEPIEDPTFARWFPGYQLRRAPRSWRERSADREALVPPASHSLLAVSPSGEHSLLEDAQGIEALFRQADLQARNDDEMRDLAYLAFFLLRRQHAELIIAPDALLVLGTYEEEIGNDPDLPPGRPAEGRMPVAAPLPDSDIFDRHSYEIEENLDRSAAIPGQRLTLGNRVCEVFVRFSPDGRLAHIGVIDTGEIIAPDTLSERHLLLVEG